jgi:hypothetical protein
MHVVSRGVPFPYKHCTLDRYTVESRAVFRPLHPKSFFLSNSAPHSIASAPGAVIVIGDASIVPFEGKGAVPALSEHTNKL